MASPRQCFVSYARTDAARVEPLAGYVRDLGHEVWFDKELRGGQRWWDSILEQIRACDCFVFMLSAASCRSNACRAELEYALRLNRPIVPVRLGPLPPDALATEPDLAEIEHIEAGAGIGEAEVVARLGHALLDLPPAEPLPDPVPEPPPVPVSSPTQPAAEPPARPKSTSPRWLVWTGVVAAAVGVAFAYESLIGNLEEAFGTTLDTRDVVGYLALSLVAALVGGWLGTRTPRRAGLVAAAVAAALAALITLGFSLAADGFTAAMLLTFASIVLWGATAFFAFASSGR